MDKDCIAQLIALGSNTTSIQHIQDLAAKEMQKAGLGYTLHNACAATLSEFLIASGIGVPVTLGAGNLARRLKDDRKWIPVDVGNQQAGDVAVTKDLTAPAGADHVFLVVKRVDADEMVIADNQDPGPHQRFASGRHKTPVEYFLRAPGYAPGALIERMVGLDYPEQDEDSNALPELFGDDGSPI
jgi:hypothetical protein